MLPLPDVSLLVIVSPTVDDIDTLPVVAVVPAEPITLRCIVCALGLTI
ncbi:MAG: hypothetical protein IPP29_24225 [Bacteroidetes bacterium]|nr:hypothetical protein [Bacteroidota bacterium]